MGDMFEMPAVRIAPVDKDHGVLGLGCWAFGGKQWGGQEDAEGEDPVVELQLAPVDQSRDGHRRNRLGDAGDAKQRKRLRRFFLVDIGVTETTGVNEPTVLHNRQ